MKKILLALLVGLLLPLQVFAQPAMTGGIGFQRPGLGGGSTGTVTSVGVSVTGAPFFTVGGSPVTTSGTLGLTANTVLGDLIYGSASNIFSKLAGNTTATKKFLSQTGNGTISAAPSWVQPAFTDITGVSTAAQLPTTAVNTVGNLSPLFTALISGQALSFSLSTAANHAFLGNHSGFTAAPSYVQPTFADISGSIATGQLPVSTIDATGASGTFIPVADGSNGYAWTAQTAPPVSSVSAADGTLTITPTVGAVTAKIPSSVALPGSPTTTTPASGDNSTKVATTSFVATAVSNAIAAVNPAVAVTLATTSASDTSGLTYSNGVSGIGATFTGSVNTPLSLDGTTLTALNTRVLVKDDTQSPSGAFNGVFILTQLQTSLLPPVLTRALDYDQSSDINNTGAIPVTSGTANASTSWVITSSVTAVGTDPLTFAKFSINPTTIQTTTLSNGNIWMGNSLNIATAVTPSGDLTTSNAGVNTLATVNSNVGTFTSPVVTANAKGLVTSIVSDTPAIISPLNTDMRVPWGFRSKGNTFAWSSYGSGPQTNRGTSSSADDTNGPWINFTSGASDYAGSYLSSAGIRFDALPRIWTKIQVVDTADLRFAFGIGQSTSNFYANDTANNVVAFRYNPAIDTGGTIRFYTTDSGGTANTIDTHVPYSGIHVLLIDCTNPASYKGFIDGVLVAPSTINLPTSTAVTYWVDVVQATTATTKSIKLNSIYGDSR